MANFITLIRLISVFIIGAIALYASPGLQLLNVPLIIINISLDGLDGIIARKRHEDSMFGAVFDISADRIIEITLWLILAQLQIVSIWIAIIYLTRGILVDNLRNPHANRQITPFSIMQTKLGKFLVASRTMRFASGFIKLITFSWLFFLPPALHFCPWLFLNHGEIVQHISNILITSAIIVCLTRGIPVIWETIISKKW